MVPVNSAIQSCTALDLMSVMQLQVRLRDTNLAKDEERHQQLKQEGQKQVQHSACSIILQYNAVLALSYLIMMILPLLLAWTRVQGSFVTLVKLLVL